MNASATPATAHAATGAMISAAPTQRAAAAKVACEVIKDESVLINRNLRYDIVNVIAQVCRLFLTSLTDRSTDASENALHDILVNDATLRVKNPFPKRFDEERADSRNLIRHGASPRVGETREALAVLL